MAIELPELVAASAVLDPTGKALLNLWLHRDMADERIAELIGSTSERVAGRRDRVAQTLAYQLDTTPEAVREAIEHIAHPPAAGDEPVPDEPLEAAEPEEPLRSNTPEAPPGGTEAASDATAPVSSRSAAEPERRRRRSGLAALALLAAIGLIAVLLASTGSGRSDPPRAVTAAAAAQPKQQPATQPKAKPKQNAKPTPKRSAATPHRHARRKPPATKPRVVLAPLPGAPGNGRGVLTLESRGGRTFVRLQLTGLPRVRGTYRLWLYNSVLDARPLADASATGTFLGPLPRIKRQFRYLDVSVQPPGSRFHSGESVLRGALARPARR
jgi:hypothetical protein